MRKKAGFMQERALLGGAAFSPSDAATRPSPERAPSNSGYAGNVSILAGILLLVNAVYNFVVWPQFWKRVAADPRARDEAGRPTKFYTVHRVLISIALVIAAASAIAGVLMFFIG